MAELIVKGSAKEEVACDTAEYSITFHKDGKTAAGATANMNDEIERFLATMEKNGLDAAEFSMGDISVEEKYRYNDDKELFPYKAQRSIDIRLPLNAATTDAFLQLIADEGLDVEYGESHSVSNLAEVHRRLLKAAMEDSRMKAEMLAECAGKKVLGIKKVDTGFREHEVLLEERACGGLVYHCKPMLADKLKAPTVEEEEELEVVWLIES